MGSKTWKISLRESIASKNSDILIKSNALLYFVFTLLKQYSADLVQYKFEHFGGFKIEKVENEIRRGRRLVRF